MNLSYPFIQRPIATSLLMIAFLIAGIFAYKLLPVSALPEVDYPTIQVTTFYPGASAYVVASSITAPLEKQFGQMPGLNQMTSSSSAGSSLITLQFDLKMSLDVAEQQVQAGINAGSHFLPANLPSPPIYNKVNPADVPILTLGLTSSSLPLPKIQDLADTRLAQKISQLPGVGLVSLSGGQKPSVRIQINPQALASVGLNLEDIRTVIGSENVNAAKGSFDGERLSYSINSNDGLLSSADYRSLIVAYRNNSPIRLADVANVIDDAENNKQAAWVNGVPAIVMNIQRQPGANVISVVDNIKKLLSQLSATLPKEIKISVLVDRTVTIRHSVTDANIELLISIGLVILVIFLFLRNLSATIIPSIAVPLSLVGTFAVMYQLGFGLNNLTLMALTIATGFVVDDAIVMIENIARYIENGVKPLEAAIKGAKQIGFTILSLTVSLIAVLIPLLFMGDVIGRLFREFAITLAATILISAVVSLTLTPMLCSKFLKHRHEHEMNKFERFSGHVIDKIIQWYGKTLKVILNHQTLVLFIALGTLIFTGFLFYIVPKGFFPIQDTGLIQGISEAPESISFQDMKKKQQDLTEIISQNKDIDSYSSFIGVDGTNITLNSGRILMNLKPLAERNTNATQIIKELQEKTQAAHGIDLFMQPVQDLSLDDRISRTQYQYSVSAPYLEDVTRWTNALVSKFKKIPELADVASDIQNLGLQTVININRDSAAQFGLSAQFIDDTLYDAFGQRQVSTIFTQVSQHRVVMEVHPKYQTSPQDLDHIYFISADKNPIPLSTISTVKQDLTPLVYNRQGQFPVATISFNLARGASLGSAMEKINQVKESSGIPESVQTEFEGAAKTFQKSLANEGVLVLGAIVVVYIVLGILYESFIHPITILSTLPSAGMGAVLALYLFGLNLNVIALIGVILLIGIVMKNAIMMIDFALELEREQNKSARDAIFEACLLRFRPILMTTMASMFGAFPLAFGSGVGSELREPLGIAIIGGLICSQLLTLYTTPVIYLAFDKILNFFRFYLNKNVVHREYK